MSDLKPCPFCGSEATHDTNGSEIWVICKKCGTRCLSTCFSGKKGVQIVNERWNKRVPSAQTEIIRCEDCMHNGSFDTDCPIDWNGKEFCNFAEREEDE